MTRPTYQVQELTINGTDAEPGFEGRWENHNVWDGDGEEVAKPRFIDMEAPGPGQSSRSLPSDKRTTPLIYVHDESPFDIGWGDITHTTQDYQLAVRMEIVVASDMDGRSGKNMRDAVVGVLENIRKANAAPTGGVFGSEYQELNLVSIDRTPTRFSNQWRCWYDLQYEADSVV